jgi:hypothetical protein
MNKSNKHARLEVAGAPALNAGQRIPPESFFYVSGKFLSVVVPVTVAP